MGNGFNPHQEIMSAFSRVLMSLEALAAKTDGLRTDITELQTKVDNDDKIITLKEVCELYGGTPGTWRERRIAKLPSEVFFRVGKDYRFNKKRLERALNGKYKK